MNLEAITESLFEQTEQIKRKDKTKTKVEIKKNVESNFNREASTLEYQLNQHLSQKHAQSKKSSNHDEYKRVSFTRPGAEAVCNGLNEFIENEKNANKQKTKSWNALNACDQWTHIKQYYETQNMHFDIPKLKKLYHNKSLDIKYSQSDKKILNICIKD